MSAIRAAAAARKTYGGAAMLPPRICPSYMRDFFLCRGRLLAGGGQKVWRIRGSDTARGPTRANRGLVGKDFATIWRAMKKNVTKRPNGLTPAERKAWDDIAREMDAIS